MVVLGVPGIVEAMGREMVDATGEGPWKEDEPGKEDCGGYGKEDGGR